jgi:hypothetical protein
MTPFSKTVSYPAFQRQVVEALSAAGWKLRPGSGGSSLATYYTARRDGTDLRLIEFDVQPGMGSTATIYLSGACFNAGSSVQQLTGKGPVDYILQPRPAGTPTPRYS